MSVQILEWKRSDAARVLCDGREFFVSAGKMGGYEVMAFPMVNGKPDYGNPCFCLKDELSVHEGFRRLEKWCRKHPAAASVLRARGEKE